MAQKMLMGTMLAMAALVIFDTVGATDMWVPMHDQLNMAKRTPTPTDQIKKREFEENDKEHIVEPAASVNEAAIVKKPVDNTKIPKQHPIHMHVIYVEERGNATKATRVENPDMSKYEGPVLGHHAVKSTHAVATGEPSATVVDQVHVYKQKGGKATDAN